MYGLGGGSRDSPVSFKARLPRGLICDDNVGYGVIGRCAGLVCEQLPYSLGARVTVLLYASFQIFMVVN